MYHFIRRFFVLVLVLAFGFSFLLSCFVYKVYSQLPSSTPTSYYHGFMGYGGALGTDWAAAVSPAWSISKNMYELSGSAFDLTSSGWLQSSVPTYPQSSFTHVQFSGSTSSLMNRPVFSLSAGVQPYIPILASEYYGFGVPDTRAYGLMHTGEVVDAGLSSSHSGYPMHELNNIEPMIM